MSGGGGSTTGEVNYPKYMKYVHGNWLADHFPNSQGGADIMINSVVELMNAGIRNYANLYNVTTASPYAGATVIDPNSVFFALGDTLSTYNAQNPYNLLKLFLAETPETLYESYYTESYVSADDVFFDTAQSLSDYAGQSAYELLELLLAETPETLYTTYADDAAATEMITKFTVDLNAQYNDTIIPALNVGFSDLNATASSVYVIAAAGVASQKTREVAKFTAEIKTKIALQRIEIKENWRKLLSTLSVENIKAYIATKNTETDMRTKAALQRVELKREWRRLLSMLSVENIKAYIAAKNTETDMRTKAALQRVELKQKWRKLLSVLSVENIKAYIAAKNTETDMKTRTALQRTQMKAEWRRILSILSAENARLYIIAKQEEEEVTINYDVKDALWDLEIYQYGNGVLSAIAGASTVSSGNNTKPSALGATVAGAATGAMIGGAIAGPPGAAVGAIAGSIIGLASTL